MDKTMTHEEVNKFEKLVRDAQLLLEEAGRMICSVRGAGPLWQQVTHTANDVGDLLATSYKLRPEN